MPVMPRPTLPPTPGSSDIKGKDGTRQLSSLHLTLELPPSAFPDADGTHLVSPPNSQLSPPDSSSPIQLLNKTSTKTIYPHQVAESIKSRRRTSAAPVTNKNSNNDDFALPPPPTRSRKIIQMKPRSSTSGESPVVAEATTKASTKNGGGKSSTTLAKAGSGCGSESGSGPNGGNTQGKKKQPSTTSVAGRKIARKTAHSLIERRRRSKMNEEFALLKSMIPACTGEMHKLAILQVRSRIQHQLKDVSLIN